MNLSLVRSSARWAISLLIVAALGQVLADDLPRYQLTANGGRFTPETIEVPVGQKFRLVVSNEGPGPEEFESHELNREKVIPAGSKAEIIIGPLEPGSYGFFGDFHPSTAKGRIVAK